MEKFVPDIYQKSIYTINYDSLLLRGVKCLLFDLDNTLVPITEKRPDDKIKDLFSEKIVLKKEQESKLLNGIKIEEDKEEGIYNLYVGKKYLGLGKIEKGFLKRFIIL